MYTIEYVSMESTSKEFYLVVGIPIGSVNEQKKITGISHLLEHLFFIDRQHREAYETIKKLCVFNAYTTTDWTMFFIKCDIKDSLDCTESLLSLLVNLSLDKTIFNKEKRVVIEEMLKDEVKKSDAYGNAFGELTEGTPYANSVIGTFDSIKKIKSDQVLDYYKNKYKDAFVVYSCRNKDADVNKLRNLMAKSLKNSRFAKKGEISLQEEIIQYKHDKKDESKPVLIKYKVDRNLQKSGVNIAFKTCRHSDELRPIFDRYSYIVHEMLYNVLREENALIYSSNVDHESMRNIGVFEIFVNSYWTGSNINKLANMIIQVMLDASLLVYRDEWIERYNTRNNIKQISDKFLKVKEKTHDCLYSFTTFDYNTINPRVAICIKANEIKGKDKKAGAKYLEEKMFSVISQIFINLSMKNK